MSGCYETPSRRPAIKRAPSRLLRSAVRVARALKPLFVEPLRADRRPGALLPVTVLLLASGADAVRTAPRHVDLTPTRVREQTVRLLATAQRTGHVEARHTDLLHLGGRARYPQGPMNSPLGWTSKMITVTTMQRIETASKIGVSSGWCVWRAGNSICLSRGCHQARLGVLIRPPF